MQAEAGGCFFHVVVDQLSYEGLIAAADGLENVAVLGDNGA